MTAGLAQAAQDALTKRVIDVIAESKGLEADCIPPASTLDDLDVDSLDKIELLLLVEEEFSVEIPDEKARQLTSVPELITLVRQLQAEKCSH